MPMPSLRCWRVRGFKCWIAPRNVIPGSQYADGIVRAINGTKVVVLVLSESAIASPHVGKEIERASFKQRPIIALKTDATPLTPALEYFLSESQWVEAGAEGTEAALATLTDAVGRHLSGSPASATAPPPGRTPWFARRRSDEYPGSPRWLLVPPR